MCCEQLQQQLKELEKELTAPDFLILDAESAIQMLQATCGTNFSFGHGNALAGTVRKRAINDAKAVIFDIQNRISE